MAQTADVAIIGAGPGGYVAAIRAAQLGASVCLIEEDQLGGVCLNRGCIPTKALLYVSGLYTQIQHAAPTGITVAAPSVDVSGLMSYKSKVVQKLVGGVKSLMTANKINVISGRGRLVSRTTIEVTANGTVVDTVEARSIVIATGSRPAKLPVPGLDQPDTKYSDNAHDIDHLPDSLLIIGGGASGLEFADIYHSFGVPVTVVEMMPNCAPLEDEEISQFLRRSLEKKGIRILTESTVAEVVRQGVRKSVTVNTKAGQEKFDVETVLVSAGRKPNTEDLGLDKAGVETNRGWVVVNDRLQTNVPGIYAIGDVIGGYLLAHVASHEGIVAVENALGHAATMSYKVVPSVIYTHPEVASVGLTEKQARDQGLEIKIGRFPFAANGRAIATSETEGFVKVISDAHTEELLGMHILGEGADSLLLEGAADLTLEATLEEITSTIHAHPTLGEAIAEAALDAQGRVIHIPPRRVRSGSAS